ncbi:MAG: hypothetical protein QM692_09700 [Thermomicrobiales bacterium]
MEATRFDALARQAGAASRSRRAFAVAALGFLAPGAGAALAAPVTAEACKVFKAKCKRKNECCSGSCRTKNNGKRRCQCSPEGARCAEARDCCTNDRVLLCASGFCVRDRT